MTMSFHQYSPRAQVLSCAAVSALGLAAAWHLLIAPEREALAARRASLDRSAAEIQRLAGIAGQLPALDDRVAVLEAAVRDLALEVSPVNDPGAVRDVQALAAEANLELERLVPKPVSVHDGYSVWPVDITLRGDFHDLRRFLSQAAAGPRLFAVSNMHISANEQPEVKPGASILVTCTAMSFAFEPVSPEDRR